jgi:hypothetical protein
MAMVKAADWEAKADALFESSSIAEIQTIESKLRYVAIGREWRVDGDRGESARGRERERERER